MLRHPEWQKMKTRVQVRADYKCEYPNCNYALDENNHLNVHHTYYQKGLMPWEYPIDSLQCLCEIHHRQVHKKPPEKFETRSKKEVKEVFNLNDVSFENRVLLDKIQEKAQSFNFASSWPNDYTGWVKDFYREGSLMSLIHVQIGEQHGPSLTWYENGKKHYISHYERGRHLSCYVWSPNGQPCSDSSLTNGKGKFVSYWENGNKYSTLNFKDGLMDGFCSFFHDNGQLEAKSNFTDGKKNGVSTQFNTQGMKVHESNWLSGKLNGPLVEWYSPSGVIRLKENYQNGLRHGYKVVYSNNGSETYKAEFINGIENEKKWWKVF